MLLSTITPSLPPDVKRQLTVAGESMTDDYGEVSGNQRTLGSGIDFFSSLGTDIKRKPRPERPDPDRVSCSHYPLSNTD